MLNGESAYALRDSGGASPPTRCATPAGQVLLRAARLRRDKEVVGNR
jgi:hypothetical protein